MTTLCKTASLLPWSPQLPSPASSFSGHSPPDLHARLFRHCLSPLLGRKLHQSRGGEHKPRRRVSLSTQGLCSSSERAGMRPPPQGQAADDSPLRARLSEDRAHTALWSRCMNSSQGSCRRSAPESRLYLKRPPPTDARHQNHRAVGSMRPGQRVSCVPLHPQCPAQHRHRAGIYAGLLKAHTDPNPYTGREASAIPEPSLRHPPSPSCAAVQEPSERQAPCAPHTPALGRPSPKSLLRSPEG